MFNALLFIATYSQISAQTGILLFVMRCAIWYHLYNLKNVKNTHGRVLMLVLKLTLLHGCFSHFLNCAKGTKSCNAPHSLFPVTMEILQQLRKLWHVFTRARDTQFLTWDFLYVCQFLLHMDVQLD